METPLAMEIVRRRKARGITQGAAARLVGVTRQTMIKWESGEAEPQLIHLERLAKVLECAVEDFLKDEVDELLYLVRKLLNQPRGKVRVFISTNSERFQRLLKKGEE